MAKVRFNKAFIEALPARSKPSGWDAYYDDKAPGLALFVYPSGNRVFYVQRKLEGRVERIKIGTWPQVTVDQARIRTTEINAVIVAHENPAAARRALKAELTFEQLFTQFLEKKLNRSGEPLAPSTRKDYREVVDIHLAPLKNLKLSAVSPERVKACHNQISSPSQGNRAKALISAMFRWAEFEGITDLTPPTTRIRTQVIKSRERFAQPDELPSLLKAIEASPQRDLFLLALLTGARRSNLQAMRWEDLNLREGVWTLTGKVSKNRETLRLILDRKSVAILRLRRMKRPPNCVWVFNSDKSKTGHLVEPKRAWRNVLAAAGLKENLRFHDLRRTLGSYQARQGASLPIIGKSLGHKSLQATQIYSRLDLDPVRQSVTGATTEIMGHSPRKKAKQMINNK